MQSKKNAVKPLLSKKEMSKKKEGIVLNDY